MTSLEMMCMIFGIFLLISLGLFFLLISVGIFLYDYSVTGFFYFILFIVCIVTVYYLLKKYRQ
jgi:CHASE2 domain-containing sensor protein